MQAHFVCNVPRVAMRRGGARPALYGHGLFGSRYEVNQGQLQAMGQEHDFLFCATDWVGMACTDLPPERRREASPSCSRRSRPATAPNTPDCDVPTAVEDETDLSNFPQLVDRVDQSFVNFMYLGRLMIHPDGFAQNPAFQDAAGHSVIDTRRLFYDGNSQGGIFGGSLIALEPDLQRGTLGVSGMNYSLLLPRSSDFGTGEPPQPNPTDPESAIPDYAYFLYRSYPDQLERPLVFSLIQQMWDHSDPDGLAAHMTSDPLPDTPEAQGPDAGRVRRPPGLQLGRRRGGADDRRPPAHARADAQAGSPARAHVLPEHPGDPELSLAWLGDHGLGQRADPQGLRRRQRRLPVHEHSADRRLP